VGSHRHRLPGASATRFMFETRPVRSIAGSLGQTRNLHAPIRLLSKLEACGATAADMPDHVAIGAR